MVRRTLAAAIAVATATVAIAQDPLPSGSFLRFPDVCGEHVVFTYAGHIWSASRNGGVATQLTTDPGTEWFPKFSPDCGTIAFTGQRTGDYQVYAMPAAGGAAKRLTSYPSWGPLAPRWGADNQVVGWTPDGDSVVFRSHRDSSELAETRLYTVPASGGNVVALPMPRAGTGVFSPDGRSLLYSPLARDFRTWKRYHGGWAQDLWVVDLATKSMRNITNDPWTDRDPVWTDRGIYFISDRGSEHRLNLYAYNEQKGTTREITHYTEVDAKWASGDRAGDIVYEVEGTLHIYDSTTGGHHALAITLNSDDPAAQPHMAAAYKYIESSAIAPDGKRVLFVARGNILTLPAGEGAARNLAHSSFAHEREAAWSPNGKQIAYISDASGDEELWVTASDGLQPARQVTSGHTTRFYHPVWSPNGRNIALIDKSGNLLDVSVATGKEQGVGSTNAWYVRGYRWSIDSRYLAFAQQQPNDYVTINIWDSATGEVHAVTPSLSNSYDPQWSPDGKYLYFLADHNFSPEVTGIEWNYSVSHQTEVYALALNRSVGNPFAPPDPEGTGGRGSGSGGDSPKSGATTVIDLNGLQSRLIRVPVSPGNLSDLTVRPGRLFYRKTANPVFGASSERNARLYEFNIPERKELLVAADVQEYSASDAGPVLVRHSKDEYSVILTGEAPTTIETHRLRTMVVPRQEWAEIFNEAWRRYRDYFYASNMNGYDWRAIGEHYRQLLPTLGDRDDLNYLIGEMIGELSSSHTYVDGGDNGEARKPDTATLGARLEWDPARHHYRFVHIYQGDNADPDFSSPLTEVGSAVRVAEYLVAIDGEVVDAQHDPYDLLRGKAGETVELTVADPSGQKMREVRLRPLHSDTPLIYYERVENTRRMVDDESHGRIGYIFIPDMEAWGLREFIRQYYGQIRKDGLIIDIRGNTGGDISRMILDRLLRKGFSVGYVAGLKFPQTYPWGGYSQVFTGQMVMLANEYTQSDGDAMSWTWEQAGRTLIGTRTWGGVIGIGNTGPLLDGGLVWVPQFAFANKHGEWVVEGKGVTPDIVVDFDQVALKSGRDPQVDVAVATLLQRLKGQHPGRLPAPQPYPVGH